MTTQPLQTSSPHDGVARQRFERTLSNALWAWLRSPDDPNEEFLILADLEYADHKQRQLRKEMQP